MADAASVAAEDVQVTRLQRERNDFARPRRDAARRDRDQHAAAAITGDMRLIAEPLVGDDLHLDVAGADRDLAERIGQSVDPR